MLGSVSVSGQSHRDWVKADRARAGLAQRWRELFREFDVVLCPVMPTTAFPHDHSEMSARRIAVDDKDVSYGDQPMWAGVATLAGLPATRCRLVSPKMDCRSECRLLDLILKTAHLSLLRSSLSASLVGSRHRPATPVE